MCFQVVNTVPVSPAPSAALNLDFVTQLHMEIMAFPKPHLSLSSPWSWPFRCHARIFYTHSTPNTHSLSSMDPFILFAPWRAGKWDFGVKIKIHSKAHSKPIAIVHRLCAWSTLSNTFDILERNGYSSNWWQCNRPFVTKRQDIKRA